MQIEFRKIDHVILFWERKSEEVSGIAFNRECLLNLCHIESKGSYLKTLVLQAPRRHLKHGYNKFENVLYRFYIIEVFL